MESRKKELRSLMRFRVFLWVLLLFLFAMALFTLLRPMPPENYPQILRYAGTVLVNPQGESIHVRLPEPSQKKLIDLLKRAKFDPYDEELDSSIEDTEILLDDGTRFTLEKERGRCFVWVSTEEGSRAYRVNRDLTEDLRTILEEAFPGGEMTLDEETWWEKTLFAVPQTLLRWDFQSEKAIPADAVVAYTQLQMSHDGSITEYRDKESGTDRIPFETLYKKARFYFGDGIGTTIRLASTFDESINGFVLPSRPEQEYLQTEFPAYDERARNDGFELLRVTRLANGNVEALFGNYNRVGFSEAGKLNKYHTVTLAPFSGGEYRFIKNESRLANPSEVAVYGSFRELETVAGIEADKAYASGLWNGRAFGENILLSRISYSNDLTTLQLYLVNPDDGTTIQTSEIVQNSQTDFWGIEPSEDVILIKTNQAMIVLDRYLVEKDRIMIPLKGAEGMDLASYDTLSDLREIVLYDEEGIKLFHRDSGEIDLLAAHPKTEEALYYRYPVFLKEGAEILASRVDAKGKKDYVLIHRDGTIDVLGFETQTNLSEEVDEKRLVLTEYPRTASAGEVRYQVEYFGIGNWVLSREADGASISQVFLGDRVFYFQRFEPEEGDSGNRYYQLRSTNLVNGETEDYSLIVQNCEPMVLAVSEEGQLLFAYHAGNDSGFGVTSVQHTEK